jgi:outer membrane lipoprotein-sorting protein
MKNFKRIIALLTIIALVIMLSCCQEGPLERAGKKVDKAVDDIKK